MRADPVGLILAAGEGTRMGSTRPKVLLPVLGKPMLVYVVEAMRGAGLARVVVVVGKGGAEVEETFRAREVEFVVQQTRLGTAHAVKEALPLLEGHRGDVVIAPGDAPLLGARTIRDLLREHRRMGSSVTIMTAATADAAGLGRVVRSADGAALKIVEELDATAEEKTIPEVNVGVYCISVPLLAQAVPLIRKNDLKGEYYLTDVVEVLVREGVRVAVHRADPPPWPVGVNTPAQLALAEQALRDLRVARDVERARTGESPKSRIPNDK